MNMVNNINTEAKIMKPADYKGIFFDLVIYLFTMFLVREIYFPSLGFLANGLFWSFSTLVVATWRMRARGVTWKELGLHKPDNFKKTLLLSGLILVSAITFILVFNLFKDQLPFLTTPDATPESADTKFGDLKGSWPLFFSIISMVLIESFLEELLDRGFLLNWLEKLFSKPSFATILAVLLQAAIFGFRHSHNLSERSITVGIIGLVMGIAYVAFGRNLWPLIIAHAALNSMSMIDRVL